MEKESTGEFGKNKTLFKTWKLKIKRIKKAIIIWRDIKICKYIYMNRIKTTKKDNENML